MISKFYDHAREQLVLKAVLEADETAQAVALTYLKTHLFDHKLHAHFCKIIFDLQSNNMNISFTSVKDYILQYEKENNQESLKELLNSIYKCELKGNYEAHIDYLDGLYRNRVIDNEIVNRTKKMLLENIPVIEIMEHIQKSMAKIIVSNQQSLSETLELVERYIDSCQEFGERILKTGLPSFDEAVGVKPNRYMSCAALSSVGKSAVAYQFILGIAQNNPDVPHAQLIFSLEIPKTDMLMCLLSSLTQITYKRLEGGDKIKLSANERARISEAMKKIKEMQIHIDDDINDEDTIILKIKKFVLENPGKHVVVYIDHHKKVKYKRAIREGIIHLSVNLQNIVKHYPVTIMLLCQLRRDLLGEKYAESKHRPSSDFIEESGSIFQDSDVNFQLWRPDMYSGKDLAETHDIHFLFEKNKKGQKDFGLTFNFTPKYGILEEKNPVLPFDKKDEEDEILPF